MDSLVSIVITTYNSATFILETLESVLKQTWKNLELIITDDCSNDDTVEICKNWLKNYRGRFLSARILRTELNTGVPANANRGLHAAKGIWIKFLGADDSLMHDCIENNMKWIFSLKESRVLFSRVEVYRQTFVPQNLIVTTPDSPYSLNGILAPNRSAFSQYRMLLITDRIHFTPSAFLHRETLLSIGGFDEKFRLLDDYPLWLNLTKNGYKLYFMDKITVKYRQHSAAINNRGENFLVNPNYYKSEDFRKIYTYPYLPTDIRLNQRFYWFVSQVFRLSWLNKNIKPTRFLYTLLTLFLNPFRYFIFFKKYFNKDLRNDEFYM